MKTIKGDLIKLALQGEFDVIVHGCNCMHLMGSGIARTIADTWPIVEEADSKTVKSDVKLGGFQIIPVSDTLSVVNAYTQSLPGACAKYYAIEDVFRRMDAEIPHSVRIGIPKIGAGIGGLDWTLVERIIDKVAPNLNITCVEYVG